MKSTEKIENIVSFRKLYDSLNYRSLNLENHAYYKRVIKQ